MATYASFKKINSEAIIDGAVTGSALGSGSILSAAFASGSVRTTDFTAGAVGTNQLAATVDLSGKTMTYRAFVNSDFAAGSVAGNRLASGVAVANLGYTPANRAGDTMTGQLQLPLGSAGTPSLVSSGNTNTGVYFTGTNNVSISTAGGNVNSFSRQGANNTTFHTQPNLPVFMASGNGGWYYGNAFGGNGRWAELNNLQPGGGWAWQIASQQGGSNLATNGRFTAPVAGWYWFYVQSYQYNDTNNSAGYMHWVIGYNGTIGTDRVTGRAPHTIYGHQVSANHVPGVSANLQMYLNAGDYAIPQPYWGGGGAARIHGDHSLWCGYLIG